MKKLSSIIEYLFKSELPGSRNAHQSPHDPGPKGPSNFPYYSEVGDVMEEEEIDAELSELKLGPIMTDPTNLPGHNVHDGGDGYGKGSKPFGNYKLKSRLEDPSGFGVMVRDISFDNEPDHLEPEDPVEDYIEETLIPTRYIKVPLPKEQIWNYALPENQELLKITDKLSLVDILTATNDPEKEEVVRKKLAVEDVGMREKALAHSDSMLQTTKQPWANGMPQATDSDFMSDIEIMQELGLNESIMEWISSSSVFNNHAQLEDAEEEFLDGESNNFLMNSEEDFNENQRKLNKVKNEKNEEE
jgi:hypothetical protein